MKKMAIIAIIIGAAFIAAGAGCRRQADKGYIELTGTLEGEDISVGSREGGRVFRVGAAEGDTVEAGRVLVELEPSALNAARDEALAAVDMAEAKLRLLRNGSTIEDIEAGKAAVDTAKSKAALVDEGSRKEQIAAAKAEFQAARAQYTNMATTFERQKRLLDAGVVSKQTADNAQAALDSARENLSAAKAMYDMSLSGARPQEKAAAGSAVEQTEAQYKKVVKGPRPEEIAQAQAAVEQARAHVRSIDERLKETKVKAPGRSVVDSLDLQPGDLVAPGESVARLVVPDKLWVYVYVPENMIGQARPGTKAEVFVDSYPGKAFEGIVATTGRSAEFTPRNVQTPQSRAMQVFRAKITIDNPGGLLRSGMPAVVRIKTGEAGKK